MTKLSIAIGDRFGRLTIAGRGPNRASGHPQWVCECECGGKSLVGTSDLRDGKTRSCGCLQRTHNLKHGHARTSSHTPTYRAWTAMRARCSDDKHPSWSDYGGRGISVCSRWDDFTTFLADVGEKPSSRHSLDRSDNHGNYEPGNVRWTLPAAQAQNRRTNVLTAEKAQQIRALAAGGRSRHSIAVEFGVSKGAVQSVIENRSWRVAQ